MTTRPQIDIFWSLRSPYSYLATPDMLRLDAEYDADFNLRPVLPIAVREPDFFDPEKLAWVRYILIDWKRRAQFLGMSDVWPTPDPIVQDLDTMKIAKDQPYIFRLTSLAVEAQRQGRGVQFAKEVSHLLFGGTGNWDEGTQMAEAAQRAGLDYAQMEDAIVDSDHLEEVTANQDALEQSGHWGVPTFVFEGEPFFGQDRIELLRWRMDQKGVPKR